MCVCVCVCVCIECEELREAEKLLMGWSNARAAALRELLPSGTSMVDGGFSFFTAGP